MDYPGTRLSKETDNEVVIRLTRKNWYRNQNLMCTFMKFASLAKLKNTSVILRICFQTFQRETSGLKLTAIKRLIMTG